MQLRKFIFSPRRDIKIARHVSFWICSYIPFLINDIILLGLRPAEDLLPSQKLRIINLFFDVLFTYAVVYYILPVWRQQKSIVQVIIRILPLITCMLLIRWTCWQMFVPQEEYENNFWFSMWFFLITFLNEGCIMRCLLFIACLMLKNHYEASEMKMVLSKENANAELQLLKAQVHPHFLFNTLNNIYSFILNKSGQASSLVLMLSDTLNYMANECEATFVPLNKELQVINDYMELEKIRYGKRLRTDIQVTGDSNNKLIAPLLMIPMVENSFKHGTSQVLEEPWIELSIVIGINSLEFVIKNSRPQAQPPAERTGIGLRNVRKRLELLYPGGHDFRVVSLSNSFEAYMRVPLYQSI